MFEYMGKIGFGQYEVRCSECGFQMEVGTVSFRAKSYENMVCPSCRYLVGPDRLAENKRLIAREVELAALRSRLMSVVIVSNVIVLKLGD